MSAVAIADVQDLTDAELLNAGLTGNGAGIEFERAETSEPKPGDLLMVQGAEADNRIVARLSRSTSDMRRVNIYDIRGRKVLSHVTWAMQWLKKRYPANHPNPEWRGKPVFYQKPPVAVAVASVPCKLVAEGRCRKVLFSEAQAEAHFRAKHPAEFAEAERTRERDMLARQTVAAERQTAVMERLLSRMAGLPAAEQDAFKAEFEATVLADTEAPGGAETPDESWTRQRLVKWIGESGNQVPDDWVGMSKADVWAYVQALRGETG